MSLIARPLRIEFPGAVYYITSRGDRKEKNIPAYIEYGYTLKQIADYLGIYYSTVSKAIKMK
ncbi:MAG: hypothetical protein LWW94_04100 [Candidatus Desulfofervidaceae bacterium]|nr:hypothetical protein [Candidatus Desulfofervidaceae bacterium]